ncbi:MAG: hypothetical protein QOF21_2349 [Actinomycetota bacterium]
MVFESRLSCSKVLVPNEDSHPSHGGGLGRNIARLGAVRSDPGVLEDLQ